MTNLTVANFNRWFRIAIGLAFLGLSIYYKEWITALPGMVFIIQGITNRSCHGNCFNPGRGI
ncbi:MAG: hypothetical protein WC220_14770 [Pedobacter sp.]|jgi:hypothetical protein